MSSQDGVANLNRTGGAEISQCQGHSTFSTEISNLLYSPKNFLKITSKQSKRSYHLNNPNSKPRHDFTDYCSNKDSSQVNDINKMIKKPNLLKRDSIKNRFSVTTIQDKSIIKLIERSMQEMQNIKKLELNQNDSPSECNSMKHILERSVEEKKTSIKFMDSIINDKPML